MPTDSSGARATAWAARAGLGLLAVLVVHFATRPLGGGDLFWMLRTGETILRTHTLPDTDTYSYTVAGTPWNNHEWGYEVLVAALARCTGGSLGIFRLGVLALMGGAITGVAMAVGRRTTVAWALLSGSVLLALSTYKFIPAPQTLSMVLFLVAWALFLGQDIFARRGRYPALLVFLLVWANLTAEVLLFLPFVVADQLPRVMVSARAGRVRSVALLALACAMPLVTPPSSSVLEYALVGSAVNRRVNPEFTPLWEPAQTVPWVTKAMAVCLAIAYVVWRVIRWKRAEDWKSQVPSIACGVLAIVGAVAFERNLWLMIIPAVQMLLAGAAWTRASLRAQRVEPWVVALALGVALVPALGTGWRPAMIVRDLSTPRYLATAVNPGTVPVACGGVLAHLPAGARVFTDRMWASYVIWRAPQARVFIDGRNREYPLVVHRAATEVWEGGPHTLPILDGTHTDWVLATPGWGVLPGVRGGPWRPVAMAPTCAVYGRAQPGG